MREVIYRMSNSTKLLLATIALCFIFQLATCIVTDNYGMLAGYIPIALMAYGGYSLGDK